MKWTVLTGRRIAAIAAAGTAASLAFSPLGANGQDSAVKDGPLVLVEGNVVSSIEVAGTAKQSARLPDEVLQGLRDYNGDPSTTASERVAATKGVLELARATSWLEAHEGDNYISYEVLKPGDGPLYELFFVSRPSDKALELIRTTLPVDVRITTGAAASEEELTVAAATLSESIIKDLGAQPLSVGPTVDGTSMVVDFNPAQSDQASLVKKLSADLGKWRSQHPGLGLVVRPDHDLVLATTQVNVSGGNALTTCTSGFSVRRSNGRKGIVTAAHCGTGQEWKGGANGDVLAAGAAATPVSNGQIDLRFFRVNAGHDALPRFNYNKSSYWGVEYATNPGKGAFSCVNGNTTGLSSGVNCGYVSDQVNQCVSYTDGVTRCSQVRMQTNITLPGDSGGPWFVGTIAHGVHSGSGTSSYYTRIGRVANNLDATVMTIPYIQP